VKAEWSLVFFPRDFLLTTYKGEKVGKKGRKKKKKKIQGGCFRVALIGLAEDGPAFSFTILFHQECLPTLCMVPTTEQRRRKANGRNLGLFFISSVPP
jgi:hypothetical protein